MTGLRRIVTASSCGDGSTDPGVLGVELPPRIFTFPDFPSLSLADLSPISGRRSLASSDNEAAAEERLQER